MCCQMVAESTYRIIFAIQDKKKIFDLSSMHTCVRSWRASLSDHHGSDCEYDLLADPPEGDER